MQGQSCLRNRTVYIYTSPSFCSTCLLFLQYSEKADEKKSDQSSTASSNGPPQANMKVCEGANIYKTGSDPELQEDSAYPDWLWAIGKPPPAHTELSPDTKQYWRRLNKTKAHERNILKKQSAGR